MSLESDRLEIRFSFDVQMGMLSHMLQVKSNVTGTKTKQISSNKQTTTKKKNTRHFCHHFSACCIS